MANAARNSRLEFRVAPDEKAIIERAAALTGSNTTDFVRSTRLAATKEREPTRQEMEQRIAAVQVLYDNEEDRLAGYYTLSAVVVERRDLPSTFTHRLARYISSQGGVRSVL